MSKKKNNLKGLDDKAFMDALVHESVDGTLPTYLLSPEEVKINVKYTITLNPNDTYQFFADKQNRLKNHTEYWQKYIQVLSAEIHCIQEVSKLGRLHWHGTILFKTQQNINNFYINNMHCLTEHCMCHITLITDKDWEEVYMKKAKHMDLPKIDTTDSNLKLLTMCVNYFNDIKKPLEVAHLPFFTPIHPDDYVKVINQQAKSIKKEKAKALMRARALEDQDIEDM